MAKVLLWLTALKSPLVERLVLIVLSALVTALVEHDLLDGAIGTAVHNALSGW